MVLLKIEYNNHTYEYNTDDFICYKEKDADVIPQEVIAKILKDYRTKLPNFKNIKKLNIGCGYRPFMDYINLDCDEKVCPDVVRNVDEGLPFDDNKFKEIYASHVIEHVKDIFFFMSEIWRVGKNKAKVIIIAPYCMYLDWAIQADRVRFINYNYFDRWKPNYTSVQDNTKEIRGANFNVLKTELINESREIKFILEIVKNERMD